MVWGGVLNIFALLCNNYYFVADKIGISHIILKYLDVFLTERNGVFVGLFMISVGMIAYKIYIEKDYSKTLISSVCIGLFLAYVFEVILLKNCVEMGDGSLYIFLVSRCRELRNYSIGIYFIHWICMDFVRMGLRIFNADSPIIRTVLTLLIAHLVCYLVSKLPFPKLKQLFV